AGSADQAGEGAGGIGATRKSQNIDLVAGEVVAGDRLIALLHNLPQADSDRAAQYVLQHVRIIADAVVIEDELLGPVGALSFDQRRAGRPVARVELGNVGVDARALFVPGTVDQNDDALHAAVSLGAVSWGPSRSVRNRCGNLYATGRAEIVSSPTLQLF